MKATILSLAASDNPPRIIIAGAGMSGICLAVMLKRAGIKTFQIFEKSSEVGGTWLDNHYPNSGCDVPSHLYSFSFEQRHDWSQKYARQPEILNYFITCVDKFGVRPFIRFETTVEQALFDEESKLWHVTTSDGKTHEAEFFVSAVGQLNIPNIPDINGQDEFQGETWHSARWNEEFDCRNKNVAVVGNGASTIQFLPGLAEQAKSVTLFQRSPNWIHPVYNYEYSSFFKWILRWIPFSQKIYRYGIFLRSELRHLAFRKAEGWINRMYRRWLTRKMRAATSKEVFPTVLPDYPPGCKRILLSSDYLQSVSRDNVRIISEPMERFARTGVVANGEEIPVDAVIYSTGFKTTNFLFPMRIIGRSGVPLDEAFLPRPKTLYGTMTSGFPNFFMLYGPNTNLGHNSIIFMVECQVKYLLKAIKALQKKNAKCMEPKQESIDEYDRYLQGRLGTTVWAGDCTSWYKNDQGNIVNNWWGTATAFRRLTRKLDSDMMIFDR